MLLVGAAEVVLRRWRSRRGICPVAAHGRDDHRSGQQFRTAYAAGRVRVRFVCLQFWRESRNARLAVNANVVSEHEVSQVRQDE